MANVTIHITLKRTEGRTSPDAGELARAVEQLVSDALAGGELDGLTSTSGDELAYEVTRVRLARLGEAPWADEAGHVYCAWCSNPVVNERHGRNRQYCSDTCRVYAWRARKETAPTTST